MRYAGGAVGDSSHIWKRNGRSGRLRIRYLPSGSEMRDQRPEFLELSARNLSFQPLFDQSAYQSEH
jgi:hypothetical protein